MKELLNIKFDIYDYIANKIIFYFEKNLEFDDIEKEKLYLGIISILINVIKTSLICLIGIQSSVYLLLLFFVAIFHTPTLPIILSSIWKITKYIYN